MRYDEYSLGMTVCTLSNAIKRRIDECVGSCANGDATRTQGLVIGFIHSRGGEDIFQRDIEAQFGIRRSTATGILQLMEKNGLIVREPVERDARLKRLTLTEKAIELHNSIMETIHRNEKEMLSCLTAEEQQTFFALANRLIDSINGAEEQERKEYAD